MLLRDRTIDDRKPLVLIDGIISITQTLIDVCSYVRGHDSVGEDDFLENYLKPALIQLGVTGYAEDVFGNIYVHSNSGVLYAAHIDTTQSRNKLETRQPVVLDGNTLGVPKGTGSVLGADDGVGIVTILWLLSNKVDIGAIFLRGEEVGLKGASHAVEHCSEWLSGFNMCIEVDRAGTNEVITHQTTGRCASDKFAENLAAQLGMGHIPSPNGVFTDNSLFNMIPECVNLAAGYESQHSEREVCDVAYVNKLLEGLLLVDYTKLGNHRTEGDDEVYEDYYYYHDYLGDNLVDDDAPFETPEDAEEYIINNLEAVALYLYGNYTTPRDIARAVAL